MSRNGSGVYTTPNTFVAGTTITSSAFNQNFSDLASEITNSVAADGQTSMTGPLKASSGTVTAPSITFAADTDTGFYRSAANEVSFASGGVLAATFDFNSGINSVSGKMREQGNSIVPVGVIFDYAGSSVPAGFLFCNGDAVSRTTYAALFGAISTTYGVGDGSTTFNVPDYRGRVAAGKDDMGAAAANRLSATTISPSGTTLGGTGGTQTHVLSSGELPAHTHTVSGTTGNESQDHTHHYGSAAVGNTGPTAGNLITTGTTNTTDANNRSHTHSFSTTTDNAGSSDAVGLIQPTIIINKIIKY